MSKKDSLKTQNCVLKVNIDCNGCAQKVKARLKKIEGVYSVNIDADQGKVVVAGNVDPAKLIKKLKSSGMHAELLLSGDQKGANLYNQTHPINNQFQNFQIDDYSKGGKGNKSKKAEAGGQVHAQSKVVHDFKVPHKERKSVKITLPEDKTDDGRDDLEDYSDEEEEEGYGHVHAMPMNGAGPRGPVGMMNGPNHKGNHGNGKEGNVIIDPTMLTKGKGGNRNHKGNKGEKQNSGGQRDNNEYKSEKYVVGNGEGDGIKKKNTKSGGGGLVSRFLRFGKKSKKGGVIADDTYKNKSNYNGIKEEREGNRKLEEGGRSKIESDPEFHGKIGMGNSGDRNMGQMGINYPMDIRAVQGQYHEGMQMQMQPPQHNQHQQQQYMAMMMNQEDHQQQQQAYMNNMYPQGMMYGGQHSSMNYMPPPPPMPVHPVSDPITHTFSDENVDSCTIM